MTPNNQPTLSEFLNQDILALSQISEQLNNILGAYNTMRLRLINLERVACNQADSPSLSEEGREKLSQAQQAIDTAFQPIGLTASRAIACINDGLILLNDVFAELRRTENNKH